MALRELTDLIISHGYELSSSLVILFPLFLSPAELLDSLIFKFLSIQSTRQNSAELYRILHFVLLWAEKYWSDFFEAKMRFSLSFLAASIKDDKLSDTFSIDLYRLAEKKVADCCYDFGALIAKSTTDEVQVKMGQGSCKWFSERDFIDISQQLILIEWRLYDRIDSRDFLQEIWGDTQRENGITKMYQHVKYLTDLVKAIILLQNDAAVRAQVITKLIKVAKYAESLHSFNTLAAIIGGLTDHSISQLKKSLLLVKLKDPAAYEIFVRLSEIVSPETCFEGYWRLLRITSLPCSPLITATEGLLLNYSKSALLNNGTSLDISQLLSIGDQLLLFQSFKLRAPSVREDLPLQGSILSSELMGDSFLSTKSSHYSYDGEISPRNALDGFESDKPSLWFD